MNINRYNYEEYFLLYVDNELSTEEQKAVEAFVAENPDLAEELTLLQETVQLPELKTPFFDKSSLYRTENENAFINELNCEEKFIDYSDNELSNEEKAKVEAFVYQNPQHQANFELLQLARVTADTSIVFPDKNLLYRKEEGKRVIMIRWWQVAAAAVVILAIGTTGYFYNSKPSVEMAGTQPKVNTPAPSQQANTAPGSKSIVLPSEEASSQKENIAYSPVRNSVPNNVTSVKSTNANGKENKSEDPSNFSNNTIVKPIEPIVAVNEPKTITTTPTVIDGPVDVKGIETTPSTPSIATYASNTDNNNAFEPINTDNRQKGKLRGFFRKVSRVAEKAMSIKGGEASGDNNVSIAGFALR
ncbi:MAG: hypothetical protein K2P88_02375 [Chitinophagaceae bacterium]|nr:hypothetical protein [Chitinophagaceae bacterium]